MFQVNAELLEFAMPNSALQMVHVETFSIRLARNAAKSAAPFWAKWSPVEVPSPTCVSQGLGRA